MKAIDKKKTLSATKSGTDILKKIISDRKMIKDHLLNGGTLSQLKEKGINFATLQN
ncbi:MAG: hypothetical protein QM541_09115 [Flavobacterium sp.]|nr:hypothetical protein [Flavobacterium sp.]